MSRKTGQITARGDSRWLVRVYLGRDLETGNRLPQSNNLWLFTTRTSFLTRRLHEHVSPVASQGCRSLSMNSWITG